MPGEGNRIMEDRFNRAAVAFFCIGNLGQQRPNLRANRGAGS
jgi:hypothetical protein